MLCWFLVWVYRLSVVCVCFLLLCVSSVLDVSMSGGGVWFFVI